MKKNILLRAATTTLATATSMTNMSKLLSKCFVLVLIIILSSRNTNAQILAANLRHSLFLGCSNQGIPTVFGSNDYGQLGVGTNTDVYYPVNVSSLTNVIAVAAGADHSLFLKSDGTVWAAGHNHRGALGDNSTTDRNTPVQVIGLTNIISIAGGGAHSLFLKNDGTVWGCGSNLYGELGDNTTTNRLVPIQIPISDVVSIGAGYYNSYFIKSDGTAWSTGLNNFGQLGDNTIISQTHPVQVTGLTGALQACGGGYFVVFLKNDGTVWSCGWNVSGELGDGTNTNRYTVVQAIGVTGAVAIAAGYAYALYLKNDGTVMGCGSNGSGQLGDGTTTNQSTPVVSLVSNITTIAAGDHSLFLDDSGLMWACGQGYYGAMGNGWYSYTSPTAWTVEMITPNSDTRCSGNSVSHYLSSNRPTASRTWIAADNPNVTGESITMQTNNYYISDVLVNTSDVPQTVIYTVTPSACAAVSIPQTVTVTVNPKPVPAIGGSNIICSGSSTTLNAGTGFSSYQWSTGATTQTISVSTAATFSVTVTSSSGCTGTTSATTTVISNPTPSISGSTLYCSGGSTTLDAGSGYASYLWSTGATTETISVSTVGTFTVTVTIAGGCSGSSQVSTTENPIPDADQPSDLAVCKNATTSPITFSGTIPGTLYNWTNDNPSIGLDASGTGDIPSFTGLNTTASPVTATITVTPNTRLVTGGLSGAPLPELLYYDFNGSGTTVPNLASNPPAGTQTGTLHGSATQGSAGECGGAMVGTGGYNGYLSTGWVSDFTGAYTISFWLGANQENGDYSLLFGDPDAYVYAIYGGFAGANNIYLFGDFGEILITGVNPSATLVTIVSDGNSGTDIYKNGAFYQHYSLVFYYGGAGNFQVGGMDGDQCMNGTLDEFRLYNRALNASEVMSLFDPCDTIALCSGAPKTFTITVGPDENQSWYLDTDNDGHYVSGPVSACSSPGAGYNTTATQYGDCDDNDNTKWQSAYLFIDNDGDSHDNGIVPVCYGATIPQGYSVSTFGSDCNDDNAAVHTVMTWYLDADNDHYYVSSETSCESPGSGYNTTATENGDCDDNDDTKWHSLLLYIDHDYDGYNTGSETVCFGLTFPTGYSTTTYGSDCDDNNAFAHAEETWYLDADWDGHYPSSQSSCGSPGTGYTLWEGISGDCDDADYNVYQSATLYLDNDHDGYDNGSTVLCYGGTIPGWYSETTLGSDCDDYNPTVHIALQYFVDADHDYYGSTTTAMLCSSIAPAGYSTNSNDCNDNDASVYTSQSYYVDADQDNYGSSTTAMLCSSTAPTGYSASNTDCSDNNAAVNPGATEVCSNGTDDNCNGQVDENCSSYTYYADVDHDTYGNPASSVSSSSNTPPAGYVADNTDCNDDPDQSGGAVHPGAADICNAIDDNCNGVVDENAITATITPGGEISVCTGTTVVLTANTGSGLTYQWMKNGRSISGAVQSTYSTKKSAGYQVRETNSFGCNATSATTTLTAVDKPTATITSQGSLDLCGTNSVVLEANSGSGLLYQWVKNAGYITGATNPTYTATIRGNYKCIVSNSAGCSATSTALKVTKSCREEIGGFIQSSFTLYPNPSSGNFMIELTLDDNSSLEADIQIISMFGQVIYMNRTAIVDGELKQEINLDRNISSGNYFVRVILEDQVFTGQVVLQK